MTEQHFEAKIVKLGSKADSGSEDGEGARAARHGTPGWIRSRQGRTRWQD